MRSKIKATFKYRDEVETCDSDSFFSSKFSKFSVPTNADSSPIEKPNRNIVSEMMKRQKNKNGSPESFPCIKKEMPRGDVGFALPSLKK